MVNIIIKRDGELRQATITPDLVFQTGADGSARMGYGDFELADPYEFYNQGGLAAYRPLETAIFIQLDSEARRPVDAADFSGSRERGGWFGDGFDIDAAAGEGEIGSLLYTLQRAPLTDETGQLAVAYANAALATFIRQGVIDHFDVSYEIDKTAGRLALSIQGIGAAGDNLYSGSYQVQGA